ncbi:acetyltransferase [Astrocystis sublimbata]|nr:acetyltransferase [Astrocystis sublimbata]
MGGTPFITLLEPCSLNGYNASLPHDQQPQHIPGPFKDAMEVRERVFVHEQKIPLEYECDEDDARSYHWVMYASVNTTVEPEERDPATDKVIRPRRSVTQTVPIGTLRAVPFPHPPHPPNGSRWVGGVLQASEAGDSQDGGAQNSNGKAKENDAASNGNSNGNGTSNATRTGGRPRGFSLADERRLSEPMPFGVDRQTSFHNGKESYIKIGRVAVVPEYRGLGIADQLWAAARAWLEKHPRQFNPSVSHLGMDVMKLDNIRDVPEWRGLVCVHSQEPVAKVYRRWGFSIDEGMGKWFEEGIPHVGMWARLKCDPPHSIVDVTQRIVGSNIGATFASNSGFD